MESNRTHIPYHVAIIMDGNGRWANARGMPRVMGHRSGMNNVQHIALEAQRIGIQALTLYTFSTENWNRSMEEVQLLMRLPQEFLPIVLEDLLSNNVRISMIGSRDGVPEDTLRAVDE
ncbi:MAG: di-trans,poly-cis-decaprenylcistransferase, partial [Paenibacillaceae bacterium]|nr:di-trans,poly-cis-decaprenylcistransferase [Paenibacillaceae bacterium]